MAGKVNFKSITDSSTNLPSTPSSSITHFVNVDTQNPNFPVSQNQNSAPISTLPILIDPNSGFKINSTQSMNFNPFDQLHSPGLLDVSEMNASSRNSRHSLLSLSQEGSTISDSSLVAMDNNNCLSLLDHAGDEANQVLMEFGFGFPNCDLVNGLYSQEKVGGFTPISCYPELSDYGYADIKPQGLNQNLV